ncbi:MAG: hypothetical protein EOO67_18320 [Microbacterium sp.]|nr:MAG: hypothetical protein EOO67_18320 [Microbacterium sp.]
MTDPYAPAPDGPHDERPRFPIVLAIVAGVLAVAVIVTLVIALTRPAGPAAAPSPSTPASGPSTPAQQEETPEEPEETPAADSNAVRLSAEGFALVDDAGAEVFSYGWSDPIDPAVAALTDAFGAAPEERTEKGNGTTYPDYTVYQWKGFALYDMVPIEGGKTRDEYTQPSYLRYTANTVGPLTIVPEFDLEIGMPIDDVRALDPDVETERGDGVRLVFGADRSAFADGVPTYSVIVDTNGDEVTAILYFYYSG